jgi:hypothetical protein
MRVGPDNKAEWKSLLRGPTFGTRHYFLHGRLWWNDPDPVYVRDSIPLKHAQLICSWVALSGQLNLSSEWIPGLSPERLSILKRTMPSHQAVARPVDLFDEDLPRVWTVSDGTRNVVGLFNWESEEKKFDVPLERLGLNADQDYVAFDYWGDKLISSVKNRLRVALPLESCVALAIRPQANHPQLISTSRHVTQGIVDVRDEKWDAATKTLRGHSKLIGNDPYELLIVTGTAKIEKINVSFTDVNTSHQSQDSLTRVKLLSPASLEVFWTIQFK